MISYGTARCSARATVTGMRAGPPAPLREQPVATTRDRAATAVVVFIYLFSPVVSAWMWSGLAPSSPRIPASCASWARAMYQEKRAPIACARARGQGVDEIGLAGVPAEAERRQRLRARHAHPRPRHRDLRALGGEIRTLTHRPLDERVDAVADAQWDRRVGW